jgi:hypothetical protein
MHRLKLQLVVLHPNPQASLIDGIADMLAFHRGDIEAGRVTVAVEVGSAWFMRLGRLDDYGRSTGYVNPYACWRSTSTATCFQRDHPEGVHGIIPRGVWGMSARKRLFRF